MSVIKGGRYTFEIISDERNEYSCFFIRAKHKPSGRISYINNMNVILSELNVGIDDSKVEDSTWIVSKSEGQNFANIIKQSLSDGQFFMYLERMLDKDIELGEWENKGTLLD